MFTQRFESLIKDPNEHTFYTVDFSEALEVGETISEVSACLISPNEEGGITVEAPDIEPAPPALQFAGKQSTSWLKGGVLGHKYIVTHRITTTLGRILDKTFVLFIQER